MSVNRDECGGRCLRLWERGSLPEVPGNVGRDSRSSVRGEWVL